LYTDDTDDTEKPLKIRSFSVFSVKSVYQKGLITAIPNEPIIKENDPAGRSRFINERGAKVSVGFRQVPCWRITQRYKIPGAARQGRCGVFALKLPTVLRQTRLEESQDVSSQ
jgi:hypothetical protein